MRLESDHLVSSLKQKLGHYHPCLLDWNVLRLVLRAWSLSGETVTPGHMLLGSWCTRCSWRTGARGELGRVHTGPASFGVHLILVFPKTPSPCLQKELGWVALACYPAVYPVLSLEFFVFETSQSPDVTIDACFSLYEGRWWKKIIKTENCQIQVPTV